MKKLNNYNMIIKKLIDAGICFAIVQSYSFLTRGKITTNQQIEIIASSSDWGILGKLGFQKQSANDLPRIHQNPIGVISKELDIAEASEFRAFLNEKESPFIKVLDSDDGKVYELSNDSFLKKYKGIKDLKQIKESV